jgi:hypothetical protein
MSSAWTWVAGTWALLFGGIVALSAAAFAPLDRPDPRASAPPAHLPDRPGTPYPAESLGAATVARDPFRVTRRAAEVAYDPVRFAQGVAAPPVTKPVLTLVGLVAGAEPTAVVVGFPGIEGPRVMRVGDQVARITLRAIARQEARLEGMDTTWVLRVREP